MNKIKIILCLSLIAWSSCKDKEPKITETIELSEEMKAYFVNYEVGTKWIYQDIDDEKNFDTIELISKESFDVLNGSTSKKGFELYYKPKKSKDFKVRVTPGSNKTYFVKIDPLVTAAGAISIENHNGIWPTGINYHDSINIDGTFYYNVIESKSSSDFHAFIHCAKGSGIVFLSNMNGHNIISSYKLINIIYP